MNSIFRLNPTGKVIGIDYVEGLVSQSLNNVRKSVSVCVVLKCKYVNSYSLICVDRTTTCLIVVV